MGKWNAFCSHYLLTLRAKIDDMMLRDESNAFFPSLSLPSFHRINGRTAERLHQGRTCVLVRQGDHQYMEEKKTNKLLWAEKREPLFSPLVDYEKLVIFVSCWFVCCFGGKEAIWSPSNPRNRNRCLSKIRVFV